MTRSLISRVSVELRLAVVALVLLLACGVRVPVHLDLTKFLLIARDCREVAECSLGPQASFNGYFLGTLFQRGLALLLASDNAAAIANGIVVALHAGAAALFVHTVRRITGQPPSLALGVPFVAATAISSQVPMVWNVSALPLPASMLVLAATQVVRDGGLRWWTLMGVSFGLALDFHLSSVALLPVVVAVGVLGARTKAIHVAAAFAGAVLATFPASHATWSRNAALALTTGHLWGIVGAAAGVAVVAALARKRITELEPDERVRVALLLASLLVAAELFGASLITGHGVAPRYVAPAVPLWAITMAVVLARVPEGAFLRLRGVVSVSAIVVAGVATAATGISRIASFGLSCPAPPWRYGEVAAFARLAAERGWGYGALSQRLTAPSGRSFVSAVGIFLPKELGNDRSGTSLFVSRTSSGELSLRESGAILDWSNIRLCAVRAGEPLRCLSTSRRVSSDAWYAHRGHPAVPGGREFLSDGPFDEIWFEVPFSVPVGDARRLFVLSDSEADVRWHLCRPTSAAGAAPAKTAARLAPASAGTLRLVADSRSGASDAVWPPQVLVTTETGEPSLAPACIDEAATDVADACR